ncbi:hypothetical protein N473_24240 [Pseudoalteromonas luteoviolacea CPMOR-1]|uniref:Beta-lactamase-related domain-containing protein n=1 Tax=Pseudoalteromonas luteoviolacea CPMOR-1 TaxID=1365248 RepID=A0A167J5T8_9GAMM|nr:serine hydrolase domain-containing protein [Pseudoalteromonas luteoviolacea]KZN60498.1 hypothetical protein N473_24240 [Pseudoalteromonas luteoviolacea CPMOR-1]
MQFKSIILPMALVIGQTLTVQCAFAQDPYAEPGDWDPSLRHPLFEQANDLIQGYVDLGSFTGTVFVQQGGETILHKGYGFANEVQWVKNDRRTRFAVGSIAKQFTAVAILQLMEQEKLKLTDTLEQYIPGFPNGNKITIHYMLTMQSGLAEITHLPAHWENRYTELSADEHINLVRGAQALFDPGTDFRYSNTSYLLLARIVELVSNTQYEDYLRENLFKPANMTSADVLDPTMYEHYLARGYEIFDGLVEGRPYAKNTAFGGGDLQMTAKDLYRWELALKDGRLISQATYDLMHTNHIENFGYGIGVAPLADGSPSHYFGGGGHPGFSSSNYRVQDTDTTIVVLNNRGNNKAVFMSYQLLQLSEGLAPTFAKPEISLPEQNVQRIVGNYTATNTRWPTSVELFIDEGQLHGKYTMPWAGSLPVWQYVAHSQLEFTEQYWGGFTRFEEDENGAITGFNAEGYIYVKDPE